MTTRPVRNRPPKRGMLTRERGKLIVVSAATIVCVYLCYRLAYPFIPALVWAVTGAVVSQPFLRFLRRHISSPSLRAAVGVSVVSIAIFAPIIVLAYFIVLQLGQGVQNWQYYLDQWQQALSRQPRAAAAWGKISQNLDLTRAFQQLAETIQSWSVNIAGIVEFAGARADLVVCTVLLVSR
jgi:predicted PurR-regulated permease PerM